MNTTTRSLRSLAVALALLSAPMLSGCADSLVGNNQEGHNIGNQEGHNIGNQEGHNIGNQEGHNIGNQEGHN